MLNLGSEKIDEENVQIEPLEIVHIRIDENLKEDSCDIQAIFDEVGDKESKVSMAQI